MFYIGHQFRVFPTNLTTRRTSRSPSDRLESPSLFFVQRGASGSVPGHSCTMTCYVLPCLGSVYVRVCTYYSLVPKPSPPTCAVRNWRFTASACAMLALCASWQIMYMYTHNTYATRVHVPEHYEEVYGNLQQPRVT